MCEKVAKTWRDLNITQAHIKYAEACRTENEWDAAAAGDYMDVAYDNLYDPAFPTDE